MPLSHYNNSIASRKKYEPIQPSEFEVSVIAPFSTDTRLILEHVKSIGGLNQLVPSIDAINQKFKFTDRSFAGIPGQTFVDINIVFTLNLNEANENYIYNIFRRWFNIIRDPLTGRSGLKKDYTGSAIINSTNRAGDVYRRITLLDIFPTGQPEFLDEHSYESGDPAELSVTFRCDHWNDEIVGLTLD